MGRGQRELRAFLLTHTPTHTATHTATHTPPYTQRTTGES